MARSRNDHSSDPHRRPLRHTYQEGPGFLFLATRGGRPPGPSVREDLAGLRFRIHCVRTAAREGVGAALALGASRTSLYRWRRSYEERGIEALRHGRRGPARELLPAWVEQAVIVVRLLTYWNSQAPRREFTRRDIYPLGHHAVDALLADVGTARPSVHRERGPAYERARPNELWHIDIKGPFYLRRAPGHHTKVWIVGLVDDHSRFLIGLRVLPRPSTEPILVWLRDCFELCGIPHEVTERQRCALRGLDARRADPLRQDARGAGDQAHPHTGQLAWTNGKIERFWGVLQSELLDRELFPAPEAANEGLTRFAVYCDYHRLHGELDWHTPAERYDGTPFTDRGFEHVPALEHLQGWLTKPIAA